MTAFFSDKNGMVIADSTAVCIGVSFMSNVSVSSAGMSAADKMAAVFSLMACRFDPYRRYRLFVTDITTHIDYTMNRKVSHGIFAFQG